jgi:protein TonB
VEEQTAMSTPAPPPAPPAPPAPPPDVDIAPSEDISYRKMRPPKYPPQAARQRQQGKVLLKVLVGLDGSPEEVTVEKSSGSRLLDQAAIDAVKTWKFNPGKKGGSPNRGYALVPIEFTLTD